jgi:hypothetical protein
MLAPQANGHPPQSYHLFALRPGRAPPSRVASRICGFRPHQYIMPCRPILQLPVSEHNRGAEGEWKIYAVAVGGGVLAVEQVGGPRPRAMGFSGSDNGSSGRLLTGTGLAVPWAAGPLGTGRGSTYDASVELRIGNEHILPTCSYNGLQNRFACENVTVYHRSSKNRLV